MTAMTKHECTGAFSLRFICAPSFLLVAAPCIYYTEDSKFPGRYTRKRVRQTAFGLVRTVLWTTCPAACLAFRSREVEIVRIDIRLCNVWREVRAVTRLPPEALRVRILYAAKVLVLG